MIEQLACEDYRTLHNFTNITDNILLKGESSLV